MYKDKRCADKKLIIVSERITIIHRIRTVVSTYLDLVVYQKEEEIASFEVLL